MKIRFSIVQDLYEEVKELPSQFPHVKRVVRINFSEKRYTQEFRCGNEAEMFAVIEHRVMVSVLKPRLSGVGEHTLYYYSEPYSVCLVSDYDVAMAQEVKGKRFMIQKDIEGIFSSQDFEKWVFKKGIYEIDDGIEKI